MNFVIALLVLFSSPKGPEAYYYNGKNLVRLSVIEIPNIDHATFTLLIKSPYELLSAIVDSNDVRMCLPGVSLRKQLRLSGRWYVIKFEMKLKVGSAQHVLCLTSYTGRIHERRFTINVEGSKQLKKPLGVER